MREELTTVARPLARSPSQPSSRTFDVCIRGGGITGCTLALLLARERLRVALVVQDALETGQGAQISPSGHSDVRAYALNAKSRQLLTSLRCWPALEHATPVLNMQVHGDAQGEVNFKATDTASEALAWIVDVPALQAQLAQATQFQAQIEIIAVADTAPVAATLTVACEGQTSQSRENWGVEFDVTPYSQRAIASRLTISEPHHQTARQWFKNGEILGVLPLYGNSVAIVWSVEAARAQELMMLDAQAFNQQVQMACEGVFGDMALCSERATWPLQLAQAKRWVGVQTGGGEGGQGQAAQSWALAGDAAHTVHPLSGQGLNLGLADVAELADLIGQRDYWRSVADAKLLRRYERARKLEAAMLTTATDGLQRLFAQPGDFWQTLRNAGLSGFNGSGAIKHWVARRAMGT